MGRNFLAHTAGDAANAVLAATGYNFRHLFTWLALLCAFLFVVLTRAQTPENYPAGA
jgi:IS5 family transposase